jgi:uncharacterized repeat protein (TIGR01451 family)
MSRNSSHLRTPSLLLLVALILILMTALTGSLAAEGAPQTEVPGYPKYGCYDVVAGGMGMWGGQTPYNLRVDVPGPVVDAFLVWIGTEDTGAPGSPAKNQMSVNGTTVEGNKVDEKVPGQSDARWYMWRADVGPSGYNLISQGVNKLMVEDWAFIDPFTDTRRNGVSLVVVYSTGDCAESNQVNLVDNMDWYWERAGGEQTTNPLVFTFPPADENRTATVWLHHAGTDHVGERPNGNGDLGAAAIDGLCRPEAIWAARGSGAPPANIINWGSPSTGANGGKRVVQNAFVNASCGITTVEYPVYELWGWVDGQGWTRDNPGFVYPEWSVVRLVLQIPAGATWAAVQAESVFTGAESITDTGESGAWFGQFVISALNPDLEISKTDGVDTAAPGDILTYTISYKNIGYGNAADVTIADLIPERSSFVSASDGGIFDVNTRMVNWTVGSLAPGESGEVTVAVRLDPVFPPGTTTVTNTAKIFTTTDGEFNPDNNTATDTTDVTPTVTLEVDKTGSPEPVAPGASLKYTIDWKVTGSTPAKGATLVDTLPAGVTFVSANGGGIYDPGARTVTWLLGDITPEDAGSVEVMVKVDSPAANGTKLTNTVVFSDEAGNKASDTWVSTIVSSHSLALNKTGAPEPVKPGDQLTYTLDWSVTGDEVARDAMLVDTLPAGVTFVSASDGGVYDAATRTVTWDLGDLAPGASGSYTIVVTVDGPAANGTQLVNNAELSDADKKVTDSWTSTISSSHSLGLDKTGSPEPVSAGAQLTYTLNWSVSGDEPAVGVKLVDTLPAGVTFVSASNGGVYDAATRTVTWNLGDLAPGANGAYTIVVTVDSPAANGTQLVNNAVLSDAGKQISDSWTSTVQSDYTLNVEKLDNPDPVAKGAQLTYTINWSVSGNEPANGLKIVDILPFGLSFVSASNGGTYDATTRTVTWSLGNKLPGDSGSVTLVVQVPADYPNDQKITNTATLSSDTPGKEDSSTQITEVVQTPEGVIGGTVFNDANRDAVQNSGEPGIPNVTVMLYKAGPGPTATCGGPGDVLVDTTVTGSDGKYQFQDLAAGDYCVKVDESTVPAGLTLTTGENPIGPISLAEGGQVLDADFGYGPVPNKAQIGDTVYNDANGNGVQDPGEVGISGVTLDLIDAGPDKLCNTADDAKLATATTDATGKYLFSDLAAGAYCVDVTDTGGKLTGYVLTGGVDPAGPITVGSSDSYLDADFGYQGAKGKIGDFIFYDANANGVYDGGPAEFGLANVTLSLSKGGSVIATTSTDAGGNYLFSGLVDGQYTVTVTDLNGVLTGYIQTFGAANTNNNGQTSPFTVSIDQAGGKAEVLYADFAYAGGYSLELTKVNDVAQGQAVEAGAEMTYTIGYKVNGKQASVNAVITDVLPPQVEFVSASSPGVYDAATRTVTWSLGTLPAGSSGAVTLKVKVNKPLPDESYITNTAKIRDDGGQSDEATDVVRVNSAPILALTKTADPTGEVKPGDTITYKVCFKNTGNGDATNAVLTDGIPTFTTYVENSATGGATYDSAARTLTWNLGVLSPGEEGCGEFKVTVDLSIPGVTDQPQNWTVTNIATLKSSGQPDLTARTDNPLNAYVKPTLTKTADPAGEVKPGDKIKYSLCFKNEGNALLTGVILTDVIPANTTYVQGSATGGAVYNEASRTLTWAIGTLNAGQGACGAFEVTVNMTISGGTASGALSFAEWSAMAITNTAVLESNEAPDKTASVTNPLLATVDPQIFKSANVANVEPGDPIVFTVTLKNNGTANATGVKITDTVHPKLENVQVATTKGVASYDPATRLASVDVGVLAPAEVVIVTISGTAASADQLPYDITNTATVSFDQGTPRTSNQVVVTVDAPPFVIPEPGTWLMLGAGLAGLAGYTRVRVQARRRRND